MQAVVLVHGAWHWGGCWAPVQSRLEQEGRAVYAPTLTLQRGSTLATHIEQVVDLIREQQLGQVVLVGHSYGGLVAAGVLARIPGRIHHTVFLDAIIPEPGRSLLESVMPAAGSLALQGLARLQPMWPSFVSARGFGIHDPAAAHWVDAHLRPHPSATFLTPFPYAPEFAPERCTYVACRAPIQITDQQSLLGRLMDRLMPPAPLAIFAARAAAAGWNVIDLAVGHDVMVIAPDEVATIIRAVLPAGEAPPLLERSLGA